jgi:hypothetical protein
LAAFAVLFITAIFSFVGCKDGGGDDGGSDPGGSDPGGENDRTYALGDTGPGGGKIFYVDTGGFTVYTSAADTTGVTCHYLEAAPQDIEGTLVWASSGYMSTHIEGTETAMGTGRRNTARIVAEDIGAPAAKACKDYRGGGKTDWFLPSKSELNVLYTNRGHVGNLQTERYWSSSDSYIHYAYDYYAWRQYFSSGSQDYDTKGSSCSVRAVRAF